MAPGTTRRGDREARRRDILTAAASLLEAGGYDGFNMREIARGAGVSAGTLYSYFQTKEHIFATLATDEFVRLTGRIQSVASDPTLGFADLIVALMPDFASFHQRYGMHFSSWVKSKAEADADAAAEFMEPFGLRYHGMMRFLEQVLRKAAERDGGQLDSSPLCMRLVWSTIIGLADEYVHKRNLSHAYDPDELTLYAARSLASSVIRSEIR